MTGHTRFLCKSKKQHFNTGAGFNGEKLFNDGNNFFMVLKAPGEDFSR